MRQSHWIVLTLLLLPCGLYGQTGWTLTAGLDGMRFAAAAHDPGAPPTSAVDLRPSSRIGGRLALQHTSEDWRVELGMGWAAGGVEARNDVFAIRDRTANLSRYRLAAGIERRLTGIAAGELALGAGPALDLWSVAGDHRLRLGGIVALVVRLPLGGLALENRLAVGVSGSPLEAADVDGGFESRALRSIEFGVGLRLPL